MSGDVQPRKRKDRKRRKDDLGVEEPRGTAAVLGEGDVFMHSQHEHGTGGHWCAKIIFFSLLAVLIALIGLIILENRGLSELEANAVETKYSGVLHGWIDDSPDNNHHDEHTLDLKNHDNDDDDEINQNENNVSNELDQEHDSEDNDQDHDSEENDQGHDSEDNGDDDNDQNKNNVSNELDQDDSLEDNEDDADDQSNEENKEYDENADHYQENDQEDDEHDSNDDNISENDPVINGYDNINNKYSLEDEDSKELDTNNQDYEEEFEKYDEDEPKKYINTRHLDSAEYNDDNVDMQMRNNNDGENADQSDEIDEFDDIENNHKGFYDDEVEYNKNYNNEDNSYRNIIAQNRRNLESDEDIAKDDEEYDVEIEKIEKEYSDEDLDESLPEPQVAVVKEDLVEKSDENDSEEDEEDDDFLSPDDIEEPPVIETITAPRGKPLIELDEETSSEKPPNTLAEEEEYEKQQEELSRQKEQASHMWLKVVVGCALLGATYAVIRRVTAPRDILSSERQDIREETAALIDRKMTLILEESVPVNPKVMKETVPSCTSNIAELTDLTTNITSSSNKEIEKGAESLPDVEDIITFETLEDDDEEKELYSEEDDEEVQEEISEEKTQLKKQPKTEIKSKSVPKLDLEEVLDDVEIIDDEQIEEETIDEDEEEISDVDDSELLSRLEAKYGRLPEPERPGPKHKDGGNGLADEWPGEPSESYWRQYLDEAEQDLQQGKWSVAAEKASAPELRDSARARYVRAKALDTAAETRRDNALLTKAIAAYLDLLKMNERLSDQRLKEIAERTLDRIRFRGNYMGAEPVYRLLIRRFPNDPTYRNNLSVSFLMANRPDLAEDVLKEMLHRWPNDRVALAHLGFVLKTHYNRLEEAVDLFQNALEGDKGPATEPRFYYHLGDALLTLGRYEEAQRVHVRAAKLGHFLSPAQRSLYNVERLKSRPWWNLEDTPYIKLARSLENSWKEILKEGNEVRALYEKEREGLKERGEWSQLDLFVRGQEIPDRCERAPVTCAIVRQEPAASKCRRGQIKFSMMEAGTHVRPHVGPTNCRLRMHLGLSNTKDTYIRVNQEIRQWQTGKVFMFDDSFEHEVWHNGTGTRLVLIVDVWHPDLTPAERRNLPAI